MSCQPMSMSPKSWFFILIAVLLCSYIKLASNKTQKSAYFGDLGLAKASITRLFE